MVLKDIHILILIAVMILTAAAVVWGTIKFAIPNLKDGLSNVSRKMQALEADMIPKSRFETEFERLEAQFQDHKITCQRIVCGRIDEIRVDLKGMDDKRERARNARIQAWDQFKKEMVPRGDFIDYKGEMTKHVSSIEGKIDRSTELLARLDERVLALLKLNGATLSAGKGMDNNRTRGRV